MDGLPSSSSSQKSPQATAFGEIFVDIVWALDSELDEVAVDAKTTISACDDQSKTGGNISAVLAKATTAKTNAEKDKAAVTVVVKKLLDMCILDPAVCRERLDTALLAATGLIHDKNALDKKEIRTRTALFYKQNKFNLLREQSEGYSKLTTELTSSLGPSHSSQTGRPTESFEIITERARPVWEKIISLIGYFDLDPNRALDIILDVLSIHLATHYTFFLALLSFSPWTGSYCRPEINKASIETDPVPGQYRGKTLDEVLRIAAPKTPAPAPNSPRVLAQVLGFKFTYYMLSDVAEHTPQKLYLTAAVLIREGFITLEDLYPHLGPSDEEMDQFRKDYMANVQSRIAGAKTSQLAMAAPLESAPVKPKPASIIESKKAAPEPKKAENQKGGLLIALLSVGALQPAIAILSKFPWLVDSQMQIADLIIRVLKHSLSSVYDKTLVTKERIASFSQPRPRWGSGGVTPPPPRKPALTIWAPTPPSTSTTDFVFFFPDWTERVPICSSLEDLVDVIEPLMRFIGLHVSRDTLFLTKLLRLGRLQLQATVPLEPETKKPAGEPDPEDPIRKFWLKVLRVYLLPALALIRGNAVCTVEVWNIIRQYEVTVRWRLYGEWKTNMYKTHPELRIREVQADRESKGILRRLSHNTIDSLSGTVAKLAHSNPCIFFANAVNQIMAYENMAGVVIQALRYVTNMGFDVLVYIILDALANPHKNRVKDDGVNTSDWLLSLASFTGMLFRRYSADITPLLRYIVHQLHNGQTTEIIVLRELIRRMAGIEPLPSLSDSQISAMAGGPALRIEAIASLARGARLDPSDANLKGPFRLGKALLDSSLALPLLIQVAQQRQSCVFVAADAHLKSLAGLYDATHGVLLQYLELLTSPNVVTPEDYATKVVPPLAELGETYGICAPICMQIIRPILHASLLKKALAMHQHTREEQRIASEEAEKRLKAALTAKREPSSSVSRVASPTPAVSKDTMEVPEAESKLSIADVVSTEDVTMGNDAASIPRVPESPWLNELSALFEDLKKILPKNAYEAIGPGFYTTFWQLSTYDLAPPMAKYEEEGKALQVLSRQEDSQYAADDRSADRTRRLKATSHRQRRDRYTNFAEILTKEVKEQLASRDFTIKRLAREKLHWFAHSSGPGALVPAVIEHCIQPRCLLSPMDAEYCAQMIKVIHMQGTPGFHTLMCYDKLLGDHVSAVLFSCSEYEAKNYGRFLLGILTDISRWNDDEALYAQDGHSKGKPLPGFAKKTGANVDGVAPWLDFQKMTRKWHKRLQKCFTDCIQTGEFMHMYNSIVVLKEILPVFPVAKMSDGSILDRTMDHLVEKETRGDLRILARAYSASLKKFEHRWSMPRSSVPKQVNGAEPPKQPAGKSRALGIPPAGPSGQNGVTADGRRSTPVSTIPTPSAPRSQLTGTSSVPIEKPAAASSSSIPTAPAVTKVVPDSIRPAFIRRVGRDGNSRESPQPASEAKPIPVEPSADRKTASDDTSKETAPPQRNGGDGRSLPTTAITMTSVPPTIKERPQSPRSSQPNEDSGSTRLDTPVMPPPSAPSQTPSAQELRETAKQSILRVDRNDDNGARSSLEPRSQNGSAAPSPRIRSPSPSSRPGTRNHSQESRGSAGRARTDREAQDKRPEREPRDQPLRRDSLTHTRRERSEKDDREKDRDRARDRHEREKDRDRDTHRERERDRERDRDRDRDRHRRDEKDRDRDRKDRNSNGTAPLDERGPPARPDPSRHRNGPSGDDSLGKRRRPMDDDPERGPSKRSSRKDGHRDERRRPGDKDGHDRRTDTDRRSRRDREGSDNDGREKNLPASTPSGPRAMNEAPRNPKSDAGPARDRHHHSQNGPPPPPPPPPPQSTSSQPEPPSLYSRIGDKDVSRPPPPMKNSYRPDGPLRRDDDRDSRKRTLSDREKDSADGTTGPNGDTTPPKRPRINRHRYNANVNTHLGIARMLLPLPGDPTAADLGLGPKPPRGRKD